MRAARARPQARRPTACPLSQGATRWREAQIGVRTHREQSSARLGDSSVMAGLDSHVGISNTHVMKSDVPSLAPPPPGARPADPPVAGSQPLLHARSRSLDQLTHDLEQALRMGRSGLIVTAATDGTPAIPSLIAVWLLNEVGKAIGVKRPVSLSTVINKQDLRSVGGVARLLHQVFHPTSHGAVAS